jgi:hypothetical protein
VKRNRLLALQPAHARASCLDLRDKCVSVAFIPPVLYNHEMILNKKQTGLRLSQNFSFGKVTLDLEGESGLLAAFSKAFPKTNRLLGKARLFVLSPVLIILLVSACASSGKQALRSGGGPVAIVSVAVNYDINWKGQDQTIESASGKAIQRMRRVDPDWEIITKSGPVVNELEKVIRDTLGASPLFTLASKEETVNVPSYMNARLNKLQIDKEMIQSEGYRMVHYRDKNFPPAFAKETGINKILFITLDLTKSMRSGFGKNGTAQAEAAMTVRALDSGGKTLLHKTYELKSLDSIQVSSGSYSGTELLALFPPTVADLCYFFLEDLAN